jgi:glutamate dehydrogenase
LPKWDRQGEEALASRSQTDQFSSNLISQVLERLRNEGKEKGISLLERFAQICLVGVPWETLAKFSPEELTDTLLNAFHFLDNKPPNNIKVRVFNPPYPANSSYTTIEATVENQPFLVDSIELYLKRNKIKEYSCIHPIFAIDRDNNHRIIAIGPATQPGTKESLIHIEIEKITDPDRLSKIANDIQDILLEVQYVVQDFPRMRKEIKDIINELEYSAQYLPQHETEIKETIDFLSWLLEDNMVLLGYCSYTCYADEGERYIQLNPGSELGICRAGDIHLPLAKSVSELPEELRYIFTNPNLLMVDKAPFETVVHRSGKVDQIGLKQLNEHGQLIGYKLFWGLFTLRAISHEGMKIPILKRKIEEILRLEGVVDLSEQYKDIVASFNFIPIEDLLYTDTEELRSIIKQMIKSEQRGEVSVFLKRDKWARSLSAFILMPRDKYNPETKERIKEYLIHSLNATYSDFRLKMGDIYPMARLHFYLGASKENILKLDLERTKEEIKSITKEWEEQLFEAILEHYPDNEARALADRYSKAFPSEYKAVTRIGQAIKDIEALERLYKYKEVQAAIEKVPTELGKNLYSLKLYHQREVYLTEIIPILDNFGLTVVDEVPTEIKPEGFPPTYLKGFKVMRADSPAKSIRSEVQPKLLEAILQVIKEIAINDRLNKLILSANLSWREVDLLRLYRNYLHQISGIYTKRNIGEVLSNNPQGAALLFEYFTTKFCPDECYGGLTHRLTNLLPIIEDKFFCFLKEVPSLNEDRILRAIFNLIQATVRTNFYQNTHPEHYISIKIEGSKVEKMPPPRPLYEIFVHQKDMEGVHIRGGKISRGGIRWSDRLDDFRTEILGLMKTQTIKNAVIVPVGSKGGFITYGKSQPTKADEKYRILIKGMLDITDNLIEDRVVQPKQCLCYDEEDPYLVVAPDKGTAHLSDTANAIARQYNFWLGDAFASGGSLGYDHKKEGITAKGTWECTKRHFWEMGHDLEKTGITVIGIGDMSGDVFGNGLLLSKKIRLLAAFNHIHIFLDPSPDPTRSWKERQRLFHLPNSTWEDYNPKLISPGGGVFKREAKEIKLSPQLKALLKTDKKAVDGEELIRLILTMEADLLWNGGIGTYIKSSLESNLDVGDRDNDNVRVDASQLQVRVIAEGGNLGLTQRGRIEYALKGGRINTDALDNSGGVDLSDHEVNLKILFNLLLKKGQITQAERNKLLRDITREVVSLVIRHNYDQSLAVSLDRIRSEERLDDFISAIDFLENSGILHRKEDFLPSDKELISRKQSYAGLTRPELALLLAHMKIKAVHELLNSNLIKEGYLKKYLLSYFPTLIQKNFGKFIPLHPLREPIIATQLTNKVINQTGITFLTEMMEDTQQSIPQIMRAYLIANDILGADNYRQDLHQLTYTLESSVQYQAFLAIEETLAKWVRWLLAFAPNLPLQERVINRYHRCLKEIQDNLPSLLTPEEQDIRARKESFYRQKGIPHSLAQFLASLPFIERGLDIIQISTKNKADLKRVARLHYQVGKEFRFYWLQEKLEAIPLEDQWDEIALDTIKIEVQKDYMEITEHILKTCGFNEKEPNKLIKEFSQLRKHQLRQIETNINKLEESPITKLAPLLVMEKMLKRLLHPDDVT